MDFAKYTYLDGAYHQVAELEQTVCGLTIPFPGSTWVRDVPDGEDIHCGPNATPEKPAKGKKR